MNRVAVINTKRVKSNIYLNIRSITFDEMGNAFLQPENTNESPIKIESLDYTDIDIKQVTP